MSRVKHSHLNVLNVLNDFQVSTSSVFTERDVVHFRVGTALCPRDLNFGLPGKKKDVDREARFLEGRMDGEVCGDLGALCHDRKGAFGRSYPIDDRIFR